MTFINKTTLTLPDYMSVAFAEICQGAHIHLSTIDLIIKERNRYIGNCWVTKGNRNIPTGLFHIDGKTITITVRIGKKTHPDDFRFVLAHEIGHLIDYLENRCNVKYHLTEKEATKFALACGCYPHSKYRGIKRTENKAHAQIEGGK